MVSSSNPQQGLSVEWLNRTLKERIRGAHLYLLIEEKICSCADERVVETQTRMVACFQY